MGLMQSGITFYIIDTIFHKYCSLITKSDTIMCQCCLLLPQSGITLRLIGTTFTQTNTAFH